MEINKLEDFITQMPEGLDSNSKARYLYLELGKRSYYDRSYEYMMFGEEETFSIYSYKPYSNPNIVICTTLSKQYKELLESAGIKSRLLTDEFGHTFLIYEDQNGIEHVTDLIRDLKNIQFNCSTSHFAKSTINSNDLRQMDLKLGYITTGRGYSNDYWQILRNKLAKANCSIQAKFEITLNSLKEFGDLSKLGESELFNIYEKFVRYCGNNQFKAIFSSSKITGGSEQYRVQLVTNEKKITYLLNRKTYEFEKEKERELEERNEL